MAEPKRPAKIFSFSKDMGVYCSYDPFYFLRRGDTDDLVQNAREIAQAIIQIPPNTLEPFWLQAAQHVLTASLLYGYGEGWSFNDTMTHMQKRPMWMLIHEIASSDNEDAKMHVNQFVRGGIDLEGVDLEKITEDGCTELIKHIDISSLSDSKILAGINAELSNNIMVFATDPRIKAAFTPTNESLMWEDLETQNIFLRIEEDKLGQWDGAITLMLTQLIRTLERRPDIYSLDGKKKPLPPVLLLLDEFPRLGKVDVIQNAVSTLRSKGVTICLMMQSITQLDRTYGKESRHIIVDNCQYKAVLNVTDPENQKTFSDMVGTVKVGSRSFNEGYNDNYGHKNNMTSGESRSRALAESREPIIYPHEFAALDNEIVLIVPKGFCLAYKERYYKCDDNCIETVKKSELIIDDYVTKERPRSKGRP